MEYSERLPTLLDPLAESERKYFSQVRSDPTEHHELTALYPSEKDATMAQKLGQLQSFMAVFPPECAAQFEPFGPT